MKYCTNCILPETFPGISFDDYGVCNFCLDFKPQQKGQGEDALLHVLHSETSTGQFDCLVPLSGGKDSSYIIYFIVKELGLHPLVVSYNSGFQHTIAEQNVRKACEILGVKLLEFKSPGKIQNNLLKVSYLLSQKTGMIWGCANCSAILRMIPMKVARKHKIPFVIWGSSILEVIQDKSQQNRFQGKLKMILRDPLIVFYGLRYIYLRMIQRFALGFPLIYILQPFKVPSFPKENPKFIHFYDYINWDSMKHAGLLENEIGWQHPVGKESRFDCSLNCIGNVFYIKDYGISKDGLSYCNFIRGGKLSREAALQREQKIEATAELEYNALVKNFD